MTKLTPQLAEQIITFIRGGASAASAAATLNIPIETYESWLASDPSFAQRIEAAFANARLLAEIDLRQKNPSAWLKSRSDVKNPPPPGKPFPKPLHPRKPQPKLTPRQQRFVRELLIDSNVTRAAVAAGYSKRTARFQASALLTKPNVATAVEAGRLRILARTDVTAERTIRELAAVAYLDARKFYDEQGRLLPIHLMPDDVAHAVAGLEEEITASGGVLRKIRFTNKLPALDSLAKHLGLYDQDNTRRLELTGKRAAPIEMNFDPPLTDEEKRAEAIEIAKILHEVGALDLPADALSNGKVSGAVK